MVGVMSSGAVATVIVDELLALGVAHVVLCPGSRSAPLAYALARADAAGDLTLHVRVDERSAAFLALGLGRAAGMPAAIVTTSGTAVANLHPAVLEASEAGVGLLVLSADRPPELRGTRANQTTDQLKLFGSAVRWFHELPCPGEPSGDHRVWRTAVDRAVAHARGLSGAQPGPVHLNVPLRDPLAPGPQPEADRFAGRPDGSPWTEVVALHRESVESVPDVARTLMVLGVLPDGDAQLALRVARRRGWPVVGEPFGAGSRDGVVPHGPLVVAGGELPRHLRPQRLLVVGRPTLTRATAALLREGAVHGRVEVVGAGGNWPDPGHVAARVHDWAALVAADRASLDDPPQDNLWTRAWDEAGRRVAAAVSPLIAESWPSGPAIADAVLRGVAPDARVFVGSSNAARDVDVARTAQGPTVLANRGLAGIDGNVSTAIGLALGDPGSPVVALMGDLTFLHDANGLLIGPGEPRPDLCVVVVNDDGGGIFATLEYGDERHRTAHPGVFERVFATPTGTDVAALCAAHGVGHTLVGSRAELLRVLAEPVRGIRVVEIAVPMTAHREVTERLRAAAADALRGLDPEQPA